MKRILFLTILLTLTKCYAGRLYNETYYQNLWCNEQKGITEYKLSDYTRVDCLTETHAVEFDFAKKWAEAVGQSIHYGMMTDKTPAIVLIIEQSKDFIYYERLKPICAKLGIELWYMKSPNYKKTPLTIKSGVNRIIE